MEVSLAHCVPADSLVGAAGFVGRQRVVGAIGNCIVYGREHPETGPDLPGPAPRLLAGTAYLRSSSPCSPARSPGRMGWVSHPGQACKFPRSKGISVTSVKFAHSSPGSR